MRHFFIGFLACFLTVFSCLILVLVFMPFLLVTENVPVKAEVGIVLGGGNGSRLHKAIELYDGGVVDQLLLVDLKADGWSHIGDNLCPDCDLQDKKVTILSGSTSTASDARLAFAYCRKSEVKKVLVVTDPYHTRRAALVFRHRFQGSGIEVTVISSNDYGHLLSPGVQWWKDRATRQVVLLEFGKYLHELVAIYL